MLRSLLIKASHVAKQANISDVPTRYNPYILSGIKRELAAGNLLENILSAARQTAYGKTYSNNIHEWPILESVRVRARPQDFINPKILLRVPASTSGTSGMPLKLWRSLENIAAEQFFLDALLKPYGFSMRHSRMAILRAGTIKLPEDYAPPFGNISHAGKRLTLSSVHLSLDTLDWFHIALKEFNPDILWVYPNAALNLIQLLEQKNLSLKIPVILSSSEMLSPLLHKKLAAYFGSTVINYYGQAERVCLAHSTTPEAFYFNPHYGKVELQPQSDGNAKIIATGYWNSAMPLVRYDTGDLAILPPICSKQECEEIAEGKRPFPGILGRDNDYLLTRDGLRIIGLNHVARESSNILQLQFIQEDVDNVTINIIPDSRFTKGDEAAIIQQARSKVPDSMRIKVTVVSKPVTAKNGKTPLVWRSFELPTPGA